MVARHMISGDVGHDRGWAWVIGGVALALVVASTTAPTSAAGAASDGTGRAVTQSAPVAHATSPALGSMPPAEPLTNSGQRRAPNWDIPPSPTGTRAVAPGALQGPARVKASAATAPAASRNFEGLGEGFVGPQGTFAVQGVPPDANGDVGPNHYVQMVNYSLAVFDKAGTALLGPVPMKTLWSSLGGLCATDNNTDPIVLYD